VSNIKRNSEGLVPIESRHVDSLVETHGNSFVLVSDHDIVNDISGLQVDK